MHGAREAARDFVAISAKVSAGTAPLVAHYGQLYQGRVRARASGRPGPRVITGDYRRSIGLVLTQFNGAPAAVVGTDAVQARRLEYGFASTDSLGRHFNQPPYPHWEPDLEKTTSEFEKALERLIASVA